MWIETIMWCVLGLAMVALLCLSAWMEWKRHKAYMEVQKRQLEFFRVYHIWAVNDLRSQSVLNNSYELALAVETLESMLVFD